jgi:hypothetical protein
VLAQQQQQNGKAADVAGAPAQGQQQQQHQGVITQVPATPQPGPPLQHDASKTADQQPKHQSGAKTDQVPATPQHVNPHQQQQQDGTKTAQAPSQDTTTSQPGTGQPAKEVATPQQGQLQQQKPKADTDKTAELVKQARQEQLKAAAKASGHQAQ